MANHAATKIMVLFLIVLWALSMSTEAHVLKHKMMESHDLSHELGFDASKLEHDQPKLLDGSEIGDRTAPAGPDPIHHHSSPPKQPPNYFFNGKK
ncbi:hypothetical protein U1Q18_013357 [Sarracenia purpurea var. burkii]